MISVINRFKKLVDDLNKSKGRIEKENILKSYESDNEIKRILKFIFDPYITTGVSNKKIKKHKHYYDPIYDNFDESYNDIFNLIEYLKIHNNGRDEDLFEIEKYVCNINNDIIYDIVTKDIKIGIQPTTLNKIFGNKFIRQFSVMLAEKYFENPDKYVPDGTEFSLTTKLDGIRCICINENMTPKFYTRQGQEISGLDELLFEFRQMPDGHVYDGELLLNRTDLESKDLYRETVTVINADGVKKNVIFNCFDIMTVDQFQQGFCPLPSKERKRILKELISKYAYRFIKNVDVLYQGTDKSQIEYWLNKITGEGGEGVMINIDNAPYECKRTKNLLKVKKFKDMDLEILSVNRGTGKYSNTLGYIECKYKDNIVKVGSGFSDEERDYIFINADNYIGKIATIKYFEESCNKQGTYSLRFPVWKGLRIDKDADI